MLISGAGIAGSTAAYWLSRGGWEVTLVEKASGIRSSGNPVDVRGPAAAIAQAMGIWPRLEQAATGTTRLRFVNADGRTQAALRIRRSHREDEVEVPRTELATALLETVGDRADVAYHDSVHTIGQDPGGVDVQFEQGPPRRFDLVIGADGLHSAVRRLVFGPEPSYARPMGIFIGVMPTTIDAGHPTDVVMYNEPGRSLSIHPAGGAPRAAFIFRDRGPYDHRDPAAGRRLISQAYADLGWAAPQLLRECLASTDVYFDPVTRIHVPSWTRGRVTLLGDAASCISLFGEGSSNAIVAAKTLADALAADPADHRAALAAYERRHRQHLRPTTRSVAVGAHFLVPTTRWGIGLRNRALRLAARLERP